MIKTGQTRRSRREDPSGYEVGGASKPPAQTEIRPETCKDFHQRRLKVAQMHKWSKRAFFRLCEEDPHRRCRGLWWYRIAIFNERTKSVLLGTPKPYIHSLPH
jgi:hypothetical protein